MNKSEVTITMVTTKGNRVLEKIVIPNHRKSKCYKIFTKKCIEDKHITLDSIIDLLKEIDPFVFFKYPFRKKGLE